MFSTPNTNAPVAYQTRQNYAQTFSGPIKKDPNLSQVARNEAMSKAAYGGDPRQYVGQVGKGVGAGSNMAGYRAAMLGSAEASKAQAQAQQELLNRFSDEQSAELTFQERQAGEQGWLRDLLLDRDDIQNRERMSAYKRKADVEIGRFKRRVDDSVAQANREAEFWSSLL